MSLKVISLNIEGDNHLDRIIPFFKNENADVLCLQEVLDTTIPHLKSELHMNGLYVPLMHIQHPNAARLTVQNNWGIVTLTKEKSISETQYYVKHDSSLPANDPHDPNSCNRAIITTNLMKDAVPYTIINTHFTWSDQGKATELQQKNLDSLFQLLDEKHEFLLCGDFNSPRGNPIWQRISEKYTDNIPTHETTSIDPNLHRVKNLQYFVDGMFTTAHYKAEVQVISGVSDHKALVGVITRIL